MSNFDDLPILRIPPGPTDDDIEFQNDMAYMRLLVDAIVTTSIRQSQEWTW
jgi:hypothetical protein